MVPLAGPRKTSEVSERPRPHPFNLSLTVPCPCAQEVQQEKLEKQANKQATLKAKQAARNVENIPVQPV